MESEEIKKETREEPEAQASEAPVLFQNKPEIPEEEKKEYEKEETGAPGLRGSEAQKEESKLENPSRKSEEPEALEPEKVEEPEKKEKRKTEPEEPKIEEDKGIYAIRTTANKEKNVASTLYGRIERDGYDISAIIVPGIKGYILVEGSRKDIDKAYRGVAHARGLVAGKTALSEIDHFLVPKPAVTALAVDYIVEVSSGPFKGERAKITRVDKTKNEITIELLEATVPIPITVPAESVRVLEKEPESKKKKSEEEGEEPETEDPFAL